MELLPGFRLRPPQDEDADEVAAFANEECVALIGVPVIDADWLRGRWTAPGVDRDRDFAVVESPKGELCGFLSVEAEPPFAEVFALGIVAPAFHGLGLGAAIVSENERRARRFVALAAPRGHGRAAEARPARQAKGLDRRFRFIYADSTGSVGRRFYREGPLPLERVRQRGARSQRAPSRCTTAAPQSACE